MARDERRKRALIRKRCKSRVQRKLRRRVAVGAVWMSLHKELLAQFGTWVLVVISIANLQAEQEKLSYFFWFLSAASVVLAAASFARHGKTALTALLCAFGMLAYSFFLKYRTMDYQIGLTKITAMYGPAFDATIDVYRDGGFGHLGTGETREKALGLLLEYAKHFRTYPKPDVEISIEVLNVDAVSSIRIIGASFMMVSKDSFYVYDSIGYLTREEASRVKQDAPSSLSLANLPGSLEVKPGSGQIATHTLKYLHGWHRFHEGTKVTSDLQGPNKSFLPGWYCMFGFFRFDDGSHATTQGLGINLPEDVLAEGTRSVSFRKACGSFDRAYAS